MVVHNDGMVPPHDVIGLLLMMYVVMVWFVMMYHTFVHHDGICLLLILWYICSSLCCMVGHHDVKLSSWFENIFVSHFTCLTNQSLTLCLNSRSNLFKL